MLTGSRAGDREEKIRILPSSLTNYWGDMQITNKFTAILEMVKYIGGQ